MKITKRETLSAIAIMIMTLSIFTIACISRGNNNNNISPENEIVENDNISIDICPQDFSAGFSTTTLLYKNDLNKVTSINPFMNKVTSSNPFATVSQEEEEIDYTSIEEVEPYTMYVNTLRSSLNIRNEARITDNNMIGKLYYGDKVTVTGYSTYDNLWVSIDFGNTTAFVYSKYLSEWVDMSLKYENPKYDGYTKLNNINGRIEGPSGPETYYNLDMSWCVSYMKHLGYDYGNPWVREDGVKMYGDYIMVAANLKTRPKGTIVQTSLGLGIVVDTGGFVKWAPNGLDIAVTW